MIKIAKNFTFEVFVENFICLCIKEYNIKYNV